MIVKVCGITTEEDTLATAAAGADAVGFNFYPKSVRYIPPGRAAALQALLPKEVLRVGVFVDDPPEQIEAIAREAALDVVQIHGPQVVAGLRLWRGVRIQGDQPLDAIAGGAEALLLDAAGPGLMGGTGQTFDWTVASRFSQNIVLAGGLDASNVAEAIRITRPWGVDACSRLESTPGHKDHAKVRAFVEAARRASESL